MPDRARLERGGQALFEDLGVISPTGYTTLDESHVEIMPRDHVLILGAPASGKTSLFRAMAGLWSWGKGEDHSASGRAHHVHAETPLHTADGALRNVLAYPASSQRFTTGNRTVLASMGLSHLSGGSSIAKRDGTRN